MPREKRNILGHMIDERQAALTSSYHKFWQKAGISQHFSWDSAVVQEEQTAKKLTVMTLNLQYFQSYPKDVKLAEDRLREVLGGEQPPDFICVQEGLGNRDVLSPLGYELCVCSAQAGPAQSVYDMVYGDEATLGLCDKANHSQLLCNQIYRRKGSSWQVADAGVIQISSDLQLSGGDGRATGALAVRSMAWVKAKSQSDARQGQLGAVCLMCAHLTGGRFEDQYFVQQLAKERSGQTDRILAYFQQQLKNDDDDIGILVGDFNATTEYHAAGPMAGYFKGAIANSSGVQADASAKELQPEELENAFQEYMTSPFKSIASHKWMMAYDQAAVGVTSSFGHLIDHMALSRPLKKVCAEVLHLTNQKFGNQPSDTDLPLTDHNAVKAVFSI